MPFVAHEPVTVNGNAYARGDVISGADADAVAQNVLLKRQCSRIGDDQHAAMQSAPRKRA